MAAKYHCNYCDEEIKKIRVKCGECTDFDLCLKCFTSGAEIGCHRNKHKYQLIDCGTFPLFGSSCKWKATEEMALLEAVELYGFGNWNDIAAFVGTQNVSEVKEHFINYYVHGNIGKHTWETIRDNTLDIKDHTCEEDRPLSPSLITPLPEISELSALKQQQLGYMPNRDDFEREFDNEVESLISFLTISGDDDELDQDLKSMHIDVYKRRLAERFRRKAVAREYNLVSLFFKEIENEELPNVSVKSERKGKTLSNGKERVEEDALENRMRIFCQFQSEAEQNLLIANLKKEAFLRQKLKDLQKLRKNGFKKATANIENTKNQFKKKENKKTKMNLTENIGCAQKLCCSPNAKRCSVSKCTDAMNLKNAPAMAGAKPCNECDRSPGKELYNSEKERDECGSDATQNRLVDRLEEGKFDVYSMPSSRLLSDQEKRFCNTIKLRPSQYVSFKALILKENVNKKGRTPGKSLLENIDKVTQRKMINFMTKCGWIS